MSKNKNILITGCAGFIGSHATDFFLKKGYCVTGVDVLTYAGKEENISLALENKNFKFYKCDICDTRTISKIVKENNDQWIVNFAAETHVDNSIQNSDNFIKSNVVGVKSLLEVCKNNDIKFFQISTDEVYGPISKGEFSEDDPLNPLNPYSATKAAAEHFVRAYSNTFNVKYLMVRPANNVGPRQHEEKFFPKILNYLNNNRKIPIYGNGEQIREWLYVKDTVKAIEFILKNSILNQTYNISSKNEIRNIDLVKKICELKKINFENNVSFVKDRPGHDERYSISNRKLSKSGYSQYIDIEEIIKKMCMQ